MKFPTSELNELFEMPEEPIEGIISIYGDFGVGKTTLALQTAINAAKDGKNIVYIYSKPNFPMDKVGNILQETASEKQSDILDKIIFIQTTDFNDLNTIVFNLEFLVLNNLKEKDKMLNLIVIDSITDLYRLELDREKKTKNVELNLKLSQLMANLFYINETYSIETLIINESSRKTIDEQTTEVQAGGKVMDYWVKYAINIGRMENLNMREFKLTKHPENLDLEFIATLTNTGFT
jgi:RecA/RadA recombinase